jgi:hypothetical protein
MALIPLWCKSSPSETTRLHQDLLLSHGPKSQRPSNSSREFSLPTVLLRRSPLRKSEISVRVIANPMRTSCAIQISELRSPMVNGQPLGISPLVISMLCNFNPQVSRCRSPETTPPGLHSLPGVPLDHVTSRSV